MFDELITKTKWSESHGAFNDHAGVGVLYFSLAYMVRADVCVCLGSGSGFVPKLMAEAQRKLISENLIHFSNVSIVDADIGIWGRPDYQQNIDGYPEIKIIKELTDNAFGYFQDIAYLHVDADHTYEQVYKDLCNYGSLMRKDAWAITVHDTNNIGAVQEGLPLGSYSASVDWAKENNHDIVNFPIGCGTALIMPRVGC